MKVMSAVQARLHASMRDELKLLSNLVRDYGPQAYPYLLDSEIPVSEDFDDRVDIIPVSDPNAGTMAQRIMQYQAALQLSSQAPQMYDLPLLHRQMLEVLNRDAEKIVARGRYGTNRSCIREHGYRKRQAVKAYYYQDHKHTYKFTCLHYRPKDTRAFVEAPDAGKIQASFAAHVQHLAFLYRQQIEKELGASFRTWREVA